jgi:succinate dehydrogenase / fumarate reductase cytochrome b subunit
MLPRPGNIYNKDAALMSSSPKPLSPHLQVYRPQLTSILSISHRFTGIINFAALVALVYWLVSAASGREAFDGAAGVLTGTVGKLFLVLASYAFFYHLCNGIRHLLWDTGRNFEISQIYRSGYTVVGVSLALTAALWLVIAGGATGGAA